MGILILFSIFFIAYFASPTWAKLVIFIINFFVPDPIPYVDEVVMAATLIKSK